MSINLIDLAKGYLTKTAVGKISEHLNEDSNDVQSALSGILPTILGGIVQQASTHNGANQLLGSLKQNNFGSLLDNFSGAIGGTNQSDSLLSSGGGIIKSIFGDKIGSIISAISSFSGLRSSSSSSLLSMVAPLIMGVIGKQVNTSSSGVSGLTNLLMGQKDYIKTAMPSGLSSISSLLNFSHLGDMKESFSKVSHEVEEVGNSPMKWLPWVLGVLALLAGLWAFRNCQDDVKETANKVEDATVAVVDSAATMVDSATATVNRGLEKLGAFFTTKLPNGVELNIPEFGIENNLIKFIQDTSKPIDKDLWYNFDRINFATGSASLTNESTEQVKNIAEILRAFPNVHFKVGGYTDNTGDAKLNQKLSQDRANAVMNAIVAQGIDKKRLEAEGYGDLHPVATNDTEEGRAENRRIAIRVTKK